MTGRGNCKGLLPTAHRGFTLVEVMVALTILTLVMLATVTGLRTLANTQVAIERMTSRVDEVRTVSGFLRDTLESAIVSSAGSRLSLGGAPRESTFFEVAPQSVAWKSTVLFGENFGGSYLVRVAKEGDELVLRWQEPTVIDVAGNWQRAASRVLVSRLEEFNVTYKADYSLPWSDVQDRNVIPSLLRMQIKADGRYWPDLILGVHRSR